MSVKLQTEHHLEFLGLTGGCTGSSEYTNVKIPHCWKSSIMAHLLIIRGLNLLSFPGKILFSRYFSLDIFTVNSTLNCPRSLVFNYRLMQVKSIDTFDLN